MITLDNDYAALGILLRRECAARGIDFEQKELNGLGFGDVIWTGREGIWSSEIKGAAEVLGGIDHLEAQLQKQVKNCDRMSVCIYGQVEPADDGNCHVLTWAHQQRTFDQHPDSGVRRDYRRRYFRMNYLGYRTKLARFYADYGVEVFEVPSLEALVSQLIALYNVANSEGSTFTRLIPEKIYVKELNTERRNFMLTLMGIQGAGVGEEVADAVASWMENNEGPLSLRNLITCMEYWPDEVGFQKLRSGKRTIGPAAVGKLRKALGID